MKKKENNDIIQLRNMEQADLTDRKSECFSAHYSYVPEIIEIPSDKCLQIR